MKRVIYVLTPFLIALTLRLYPTLISGLPFSTDSWPLIRFAETLIEKTPVDLGDNNIFDAYNNYWPASSIFGAVLSQVTGLSIMRAMAVGIPMIAALSILTFYALARRVCGSDLKAFYSSTIMAAAFPHILFTAGVTKETYANPIYMLVILILLTSGGSCRRNLLFALSSVALAMAHHLTSLVALAIVVSITLFKIIRGFMGGANSNMIDATLPLIMAASIAIYFAAYAHLGFKWTLSASDLITAASYQVVAFLAALYVAIKPRRAVNHGLSVKRIIVVAFTLMIIFICMKRPMVPGAPILPAHYLMYAAPFILAASLATLDLDEGRGIERAAVVFWLAVILGLEGYAIFGNTPIGLGLAYRMLNFLWPPLALASSMGIHRTYKTNGVWHKRSLTIIAGIILLTLFVALGCSSFYASILIQERYMGYFWLYKIQEYGAAAWIKENAGTITVAGDVKIQYLMKGYFNIEVDPMKALKYLFKAGEKEPSILFIYDQMFRNGYVLYGGYSVDLPKDWLKKARKLNFVYTNGLAEIYAG